MFWVHTTDPLPYLTQFGDRMAFAIGVVLLVACAVRLWKRSAIRRASNKGPDEVQD